MTTHTHVSIGRSGDAGATGALGAHITPIAAIMARFAPADRLHPAERQRLMDACADECRTSYDGQEINWSEVDRIDAMIAETSTRRELISLLNKYKAVILNGHNSQ